MTEPQAHSPKDGRDEYAGSRTIPGTSQPQPSMAELKEAAKLVSESRNAAFEAALELCRDVVLVSKSEHVQAGLLKFMGAETDLDDFNEAVAAFKSADRVWTGASENLLQLVGGRKES